jgi:hypothetical protein
LIVEVLLQENILSIAAPRLETENISAVLSHSLKPFWVGPKNASAYIGRERMGGTENVGDRPGGWSQDSINERFVDSVPLPRSSDDCYFVCLGIGRLLNAAYGVSV